VANKAARERPTTKPPWAAHNFDSTGFAGGLSIDAGGAPRDEDFYLIVLSDRDFGP
jgi:hypothetical protein